MNCRKWFLLRWIGMGGVERNKWFCCLWCILVLNHDEYELYLLWISVNWVWKLCYLESTLSLRYRWQTTNSYRLNWRKSCKLPTLKTIQQFLLLTLCIWNPLLKSSLILQNSQNTHHSLRSIRPNQFLASFRACYF